MFDAKKKVKTYLHDDVTQAKYSFGSAKNKHKKRKINLQMAEQ